MRERSDVLVVGGGLTGLALACALGTVGAAVALVERRALATLIEPAHDGRVTAVARAGRLLLERIGVWAHLPEEEAQPILDIEVGEGGSPVVVRYDHAEVGGAPLGWIVENRALRLALMSRLATLPQVSVRAPAEIVSLERDGRRARAVLADGTTLDAALVAACEGRESGTREAAGIGARRWGYEQTAMVCSFAHDEPHHGRAIERFFPDGPLAFLPQAGTAEAPHRSSIVWALALPGAVQVQASSDDAFTAEVQERMAAASAAARVAPGPGRLRLVSRRWAHPLSLVWADAYTGVRLALVGDTARAIHPIAGQGWNIALRDVAALAEIVRERIRLGLDPGEATALERYAAWRELDGLTLVAVTDGINRLFANDLLPLRLARNLGLGLVERAPPVKRLLMRHAMGLLGELPPLMRAA